MACGWGISHWGNFPWGCPLDEIIRNVALKIDDWLGTEISLKLNIDLIRETKVDDWLSTEFKIDEQIDTEIKIDEDIDTEIKIQ